jgi:type VI secretion system protein ImpM
MRGAVGAFGKLPSMGDFLRADTPPGFVEAWDAWLQRAIVGARQSLGGRWQECYFSAPIWRFTLAHGLAGRLPILGILMASVDRVGRQFPLTLAAPLPQGSPPILAHLMGETIFTRLEDLALEALETGLDRAQFLHRLAALPPVGAPRLAPTAERAGAITMLRAGTGRTGSYLAAGLLEPRYRQPSIWSTLLAEGTRVLMTEGLPRDGQVAGLFDLAAPIWQGREATTAAGVGGPMP